MLKAGCRTFFVADLSEGRRVRAIAPQAVIYVLSGVFPNTGPALAEARLRPVINSVTELAEWDAFVATNNWRGGAALHVDTGMNRLGLTPEEAAASSPRPNPANHGIELLMSHLACAETPDHPMNDKQIRSFRDIRIQFRGVPSSLANSSGIFLGGTVHCDLVRPGAALYGVNPDAGQAQSDAAGGRSSKAVSCRCATSSAATPPAIARTGRRRAPSRLAIIAVGYGDGYLHAAAADAAKAAGGIGDHRRQALPLVGRVSMDYDRSGRDRSDRRARTHRGDFATLIGGDISVDDLAAAAGTIGYEVLTSLGRRYHRIYKTA